MAANYILHMAYPFFALLIVLEFHFYKKRGMPFPFRESIVSLIIALSYQFINYQAIGLLTPLNDWFYHHSLFTISSDDVSSWVLGFFAIEFAYYWQHRCGHRVRWIWASHSVHHSLPQITFSGAYRLGITGFISGLFVFFLPLMWIGFPPEMIGVIYASNLIYQFWLHTELVPKLGALEHIFNTPSHHRVHHSVNEVYLDKNFGGVLIIFDKIFGTFAREDEAVKLSYGIVNRQPTYKISRILFQEWRSIARDVARAPDLRSAFMYMFGPPGWTPSAAAAPSKSHADSDAGDLSQHIAG